MPTSAEQQSVKLVVAERDPTVETVPKGREIAPNSSQQQKPLASGLPNLQEHPHWRKNNPWYTDPGKRTTNSQRPLVRKSCDLLRPLPESGEETPPDIRSPFPGPRPSLDEDSISRTQKYSCLGTVNGNVYLHKAGHAVKKIVDVSNWAVKEPTASLVDTEASKPTDPPRDSTRALFLRSVSQKAVKTFRRSTEAERKMAQSSPASLQGNHVIREVNESKHPESAIRTSRPSQVDHTVSQHEVDEVQRQSAELQRAMTEYQSSSFQGNLEREVSPDTPDGQNELGRKLPDINKDSLGDLFSQGQKDDAQHERATTSPERVNFRKNKGFSNLSRHQEGNTAWKTSNPSHRSQKPLPAIPMFPVQVRSSSKQGTVTFNPAPHLDAGPSDGRFKASIPSLEAQAGNDGDVFMTRPLDTNREGKEQASPKSPTMSATFSLSHARSAEALSVTLSVIEAESQSNSQTPVDYPTRSSSKPRILHSAQLSLGKAPGDPPTGPLPDVPENIDSPDAVERVREGAGSRASTRSKRSSRNIRSHSSLTEQAAIYPTLGVSEVNQGSPRRQCNSPHKANSVRSLSSGRVPVLNEGGGITPRPAPSIPSGHPMAYPASRQEKVHARKYQDTAPIRAKHGNRRIKGDHESIQEEATAEEGPTILPQHFPQPPSSRPASRAPSTRRRVDGVILATSSRSRSTSPVPVGTTTLLPSMNEALYRPNPLAKQSHTSIHSHQSATTVLLPSPATPPISSHTPSVNSNEDSLPADAEADNTAVGTTSSGRRALDLDALAHEVSELRRRDSRREKQVEKQQRQLDRHKALLQRSERNNRQIASALATIHDVVEKAMGLVEGEDSSALAQAALSFVAMAGKLRPRPISVGVQSVRSKTDSSSSSTGGWSGEDAATKRLSSAMTSPGAGGGRSSGVMEAMISDLDSKRLDESTQRKIEAVEKKLQLKLDGHGGWGLIEVREEAFVCEGGCKGGCVCP